VNLTKQIGESVTVLIQASTHQGKVVREGSVHAEFWGPHADPHNAADYLADCTWDPKLRRWSATVSTEGWRPGTWRVCGRVAAEGARSWDWQTFTLE
jgi:hypothetical protein